MKALKKMLTGIIVMMALALCAVPMSPVHANEYAKNGFNLILKYSPEWPQVSVIRLKEFRKGDVKNLKIKFSNKKIASAELQKDEENGEFYIGVMAKKLGKTKITITANVKKKKVTCKGTITVINRKGLTQFTIDGTDRLQDVAYDDSTSYCFVNTNKESVKLEYKLASGWKVKSVTYTDNEQEKNFTGKFQSGISLPVSDHPFLITLVYKKGKTQFYNEILITKTIYN